VRRSKSENKEGAKARVHASAQGSGAPGSAASGAESAARVMNMPTPLTCAAVASAKSPQNVQSGKETPKQRADQKRADQEKLQTGGVKAGQLPAKKRVSSAVAGGGGASPQQKAWIKPATLHVPVLDESNDPDLAREVLAVRAHTLPN